MFANHREEMGSRLLSVASGSSPLENDVQLISAAVIIFEHSFYVFDKRRYLQDKQKSDPSFDVACEQYIASPRAAAVKKDVRAAARAYNEAVRSAVYTNQGNLLAWMAKLPFEPFKRKAKKAIERPQEEQEILCSQAEGELIKTILEITFNNRLPRP
ncbi:hypothetical protein DFJ58DRAFT_765514 [Suillus subalutaceus]|uniref:uncharacterized protein n=1 Tax=Suillus subalutaceus TaxID=48586 RepID=UPI001B872BCA|nr:uncharacterized protein DFJ58DRAFT_765514 [Suillus subalutaceus]KAG1869350.1 hypothetical protein DFJ58DRAFT_765514 [Suillus subalutaceus]